MKKRSTKATHCMRKRGGRFAKESDSFPYEISDYKVDDDGNYLDQIQYDAFTDNIDAKANELTKIDEIKYWNYDTNRKYHYIQTNVNDLDAVSQIKIAKRIVPKVDDNLILRSKGHDKMLYRGILYDGELQPFFKNGLDSYYWHFLKYVANNGNIENDLKFTYDIVEEQIGNASLFVPCTTSMYTALQFILYRAYKHFSKDTSPPLDAEFRKVKGLLFLINSSRSIDLDELPDKYKRNFGSENVNLPFYHFHDKDMPWNYNESLLSSKILPDEIIGVFSIAVIQEIKTNIYKLVLNKLMFSKGKVSMSYEQNVIGHVYNAIDFTNDDLKIRK